MWASPAHARQTLRRPTGKLRNGSRRDETRFSNKTGNGSGLRRCYDVAVAGDKVTAGR
ncbi:hypothetical protein [Pectobacterium brasiliense]|uniref:hypothetical protein n=1 Tax=Pectobacterium brasiliense TaxID=180957 RepID=UPI0025A2FFBA|nr:hypothetical protein [Pectobacterium brasiliense]WJM80598.1 hypothetical protein QTI90_20455 [Pectobacterium brasiliense]